MIVELNKIYILSAPLASEGMTPDEADFLTFTSNDITYAHMNKLENAAKTEKTVKGLSKVFNHQGSNLQVIMYITNYPESKAKKLINETILRYAKNIAEAKKAKK